MSSALAAIRRRRDQRIRVYNPTMFTDSVEVGGVWYHFDPKGEAHCACEAHKGNNRGVHQGLEWPRDSRNRLVITEAPKVAANGEMTADTCAEMIVSEEMRGLKHFVILEGTEAEIARIKLEAEMAWSKMHADDVEEKIGEWERRIAELQAAQPGALPPRQPPDIQEAYRFRKLWNQNKVERSAHVCGTCGKDATDAEDLRQHIIEEHPGIAAERGLNRVAAAPVAVPPKRAKRELPPLAERAAATNAAAAAAGEIVDPPEEKDGEGVGAEVAPPAEGDAPDELDEQETGDIIRRRAERIGVELSVADKTLLSVDDPGVIADVKVRIDALRDARRKLVEEQRARRAQGASAGAPAQ
jgi:hypothetical protein